MLFTDVHLVIQIQSVLIMSLILHPAIFLLFVSWMLFMGCTVLPSVLVLSSIHERI
jgi:hypothetical protein